MNSSGMTMVEVLIVAAIMGAAAIGMLEMYKTQQAQTAKIELLFKSEQLRSVIGSQFLDQSDMCKCLFDGASDFPNSGIAKLLGANPSVIGRYDFVTPGDCSSAILAKSFVNTTGIDNLKLLSIELVDIQSISGSYFGELQVKVNSTKKVIGVNQQFLKIPVRVNTSASAGMQKFEGCSLAGVSGSNVVNSNIAPNGFMELGNGLIMQWGVASIGDNRIRYFDYNVPFKTDAYSITVSGTNSSDMGTKDNDPTVYLTSTASKTRFRVINTRGSTMTFSWWAVGK